ncbi:hypothetical protein QMK19_04180 [Streptomyces sp. H10-C2]|uniref:hypothetical protein n=1 Tax=unclassified Streptomyces TaxID=2593676 RepID=UPI0024B97AF2|nr:MULTISPECIES: hypothetical protein [unclassified Streptomyces]MDJ0343523.1 hypothetical protein [Streptomyces sp. PH10-H1]MDJ0368901.1 hypothetical protein [Streptomyces sp. H10-C2]
MPFARATATTLITAALLLAAAPYALADSGTTLSVDPSSSHQRGREATFIVAVTESDLGRGKGTLTIGSRAFVKPVTLTKQRFHEGKTGGELYAETLAMVLCDINPGPYTVELKDGVSDQALAAVTLTVVPEMDPGNQQFCGDPSAGYDSVADKTSEAAADDNVGHDGIGVGTIVAGGVGIGLVSSLATGFAVSRWQRRTRREAE